MIGQTLSHFKITAKLGEGGMGEVYRAEDTKLGRGVAIKVLPEAVAQDPERLARFEREAQVLASLNHPSIAAIYQVEQDEELHFLVMELVEGEDLKERLERGAVPVDEAIPIAFQIAEALEAAHESGVIHRDLKPANVKVKPDGQVKVLDFGLAKALELQEPGSSSRALSMSPTLTAQMTQAGVLLGTAAYMSPEQARGQEADKRTDIWAFGVVLWEMLTGQRLFVGDTVSDTLAEVLKTEPDPSMLPKNVPPSIYALLQRCLTRDAKQRLRDIGEARIVLDQPVDDIAFDRADEPGSAAGGRLRNALVGICLVLVAGFAGWFLGHSTPVPPKPSAGYSFLISEPAAILSGSIAVSPDGAQVAFLARGDQEEERLWVRPLDSFAARPLPGTEGARRPFWSPDSQEIAFFVKDELRRIKLDGAEARKITDYPKSVGGTWGSDGTILLGSIDGLIHQVAATGGVSPRPALERTAAEGPSVSHGWPVFLPDGRHYVFLSDGAGGEDGLDHRIQLAVLGESESRTILPNLRSSVEVDPQGRLLYGQNNSLVAHRMNFDSLELIDDPFLVAEDVFTTDRFHRIPVSVGGSGVLAFQTGTSGSRLAWRDQTGALIETQQSDGWLRDPRLSPDGRSVTFDLRHSSDDRTIWVLDLERGVKTQLSPSGALSDSPAWTPDSKWVYFNTAGEGGWRIFRQPREGSAEPEPVIEERFGDLAVADISPDGRWLLVAVEGKSPTWDLWLLPLDIEGAEPEPWLESPVSLYTGRFSPDSQWIAYTSVEGAEDEVFVRGVDGDGRRWQISSGGGTDPAWSPDGSRLHYLTEGQHLVSVPIQLTETEVLAGAPEELFRIPNLATHGSWRNNYDVTSDGRYLFAERSGERGNHIHVQTAWKPESQ